MSLLETLKASLDDKTLDNDTRDKTNQAVCCFLFSPT